MNAGWIVEMVGIAVGIFGTYCGIKNTSGPRERAFMIKASGVCWVYVLGYLLLLVVLPRPYGWFAVIPYVPFRCLAIVYVNRVQQKIRREESETPATARTLC